MIIGSLWIATGFVIAFVSGLPNGSLSGVSRDLVISTWRLTITGALGLLLAAEGCRMFQFGWFRSRDRRRLSGITRHVAARTSAGAIPPVKTMRPRHLPGR